MRHDSRLLHAQGLTKHHRDLRAPGARGPHRVFCLAPKAAALDGRKTGFGEQATRIPSIESATSG